MIEVELDRWTHARWETWFKGLCRSTGTLAVVIFRHQADIEQRGFERRKAMKSCNEQLNGVEEGQGMKKGKEDADLTPKVRL